MKSDKNSLQINTFLQMHHLFRRLQQRNRFVDVEPESQLTLAETHLLKQIIVEPELTQAGYKKLFSLPQSHIGRIIDRLVKRGLIIKKVNPGDSRQQILNLTEKGNQAVIVSDKVVNECYNSFSRLLSKSEKNELTRFFKCIADGYGHPEARKRPEETEYSLHQRRITRCFRLLGKGVFNSKFNSTQWQLLSSLVDSGSAMSPGNLANKIGISKAAVTSVLKNLSRDKLIESKVNKLDGRALDITITDVGRKAVSQVENTAAAELQHALRSYSHKQCQKWLTIFKKYIVDSDETIAIPSLDLRLITFCSKSEKAEARARLITALVEQNLQQYCPSTIASEDSITVGFKAGSRIYALFDIAQDGKAFLLNCGYFIKEADTQTKLRIYHTVTGYLKNMSASNKMICLFEPLENYFKK